MTILHGLAGAGLAASVVLLAGSAQAVEPLSWSFAYSAVKRCTVGADCTNFQAEILDQTINFGLNQNAFASSSPVDYAGVTSSDYGSAFASADATGPLGLPELHASTTGTVVAGSPTTFSWNFGQAQGVQGFEWTGATAIDVPIDAFVGQADYVYSGVSVGLFSAGLAVLSDEVTQAGVSDAWYRYSSTPGFFGQFDATCATTGAIALANPAQLTLTGAGSNSLTVTPTSCLGGGATTFTLDPGETFYLWTRMSTFRAAEGMTDAANTFTIGFSPNLDPELQRLLAANLVQTPGVGLFGAVPEPRTWATLIVGFIGIGAALRARRGRLSLRPTGNGY